VAVKPVNHPSSLSGWVGHMNVLGIGRASEGGVVVCVTSLLRVSLQPRADG